LEIKNLYILNLGFLKSTTMTEIIYQCFDCLLQDTDADTFSDSISDEERTLVIHTFGKTDDGKSVAVHVNGFMPYIYVEYKKELMNEYEYDNLVQVLKNNLIKWIKTDEGFEIEYDGSENIIPEGIFQRKTIWGYDFQKETPFFKFSFTTLYAFKKTKYLLQSCQKNNMTSREMQDFYYSQKEIAAYQDKYLYSKEMAIKYDTPEQCLKFITKLGKKDMNFGLAKCKLYDVIDPVLRFAHQKDLKMASWFKIKNFTIVDEDDKKTTCQEEYEVHYDDLYDCKKDTINTSIKEMAFDIESYSPDDKFPDATNVTDVVYQIGITMKLYSDKKAKRLLLHLSNTGICRDMQEKIVCVRGNENLPELCKNKTCILEGHVLDKVDQTVENFKTESELLLRFKDIIVDESPDLVYGYNSDKFDWDYLFKRAAINGITFDFCKLSKLKDFNCKIVTKKFSSSAYGENIYYRVDIPGILNIDLMIWIQRNMPSDRYPDYKLDTIAEIEVNQKKHDISFKEIFSSYRHGDSDLLTKVGDYCLQDTILVQQLINKLDVVTQLFEMSNLASVPVSYLLSKGQQIKVYSIITKDAMNKGYVVPLLDLKDQDSFTGAIVLDPKIGTFDTPIAVLDFASLYPSIQVAYKICYSTIVLDTTLRQKLCNMKDQGLELKIDDSEFDFIEWDDQVIKYTDPDTGIVKIFTNADAAKEFTQIPKKDILLDIKHDKGRFIETIQHYLFFFVQNKTSMIPDIQVTLKASRKNVKKMMGLIENSTNPEDQLQYRVLNGRQLAIKVTMNSIYGFTSAFVLNLSSLSACVTARGRQMIEMTRDFMENEFEHIAKTNTWTEKEENTWYNHIMREIETTTPEKGWIRKYPIAKAGETWIPTDHHLNINVVGGDTDSVFCNFPNSTMEETISLNHKAEVLLTDSIFNRRPIEMEYEKTYCPMVIVKKKNYIGIKYEMNPNKWKVDFKGIAIKRRNYCQFTKDVYWSVIYPILGIMQDPLKKGSYIKVDWDLKLGPDKALDTLHLHLLQLVDTNFDSYKDFVISASLKSNYKQENLPHVDLAKRMEIRDPCSAPKSGQRFGYVIVNEDSRGNEVYAKSEDPDYAIQNNLPLDLLFYLNNQIRKPLTSFLALSGRCERIDFIFNDVQEKIFDKLRKYRQSLQNQAKMDFFNPNKRHAPVAPLVKPKKQALAVKKRKLQQSSSSSTPSLEDFFSKQI
jgi:DNA polymerase elongation subunit (family B)